MSSVRAFVAAYCHTDVTSMHQRCVTGKAKLASKQKMSGFLQVREAESEAFPENGH